MWRVSGSPWFLCACLAGRPMMPRREVRVWDSWPFLFYNVGFYGLDGLKDNIMETSYLKVRPLGCVTQFLLRVLVNLSWCLLLFCSGDHLPVQLNERDITTRLFKPALRDYKWIILLSLFNQIQKTQYQNPNHSLLSLKISREFFEPTRASR